MWFLRKKAGEGGGGGGALYSHMTVSPRGKNVFLTLNSKLQNPRAFQEDQS